MELNETIDIIRPSIVQIAFFANNFTEDFRTQVGAPFLLRPLGTGFFVNEDAYIITARHVVTSIPDIPAGTKKLKVGLPMPEIENLHGSSIRGAFKQVDCQLVDQDIDHDIALLKLDTNPFKTPIIFAQIHDKTVTPNLGVVKINANRPNEGVRIAVSGYPLGQPVLISNSGILASSWPTASKVTLKEIPIPGFPPGFPNYFPQTEISDIYYADVNVNPGNSGGPFYLADGGSVIGICQAFLKTCAIDSKGKALDLYYNSGLTILVPSIYIVELLKKNGIEFSQSE